MTWRILSWFVAAGASAFLYGACGTDPEDPGDSGDPIGPPALTPTFITTVPPEPESCVLGVPVELRARVTDENGVAVPDMVVTFTVGGGAGTVSPPTSVTDADGIAATWFTCGPPVGLRSNGATATFEGLLFNAAGWSLNASAGALAQVDFLPGPTPDSMPVLAGFTEPIELAGLLLDRFGESPMATVTWEVIGGGKSLASSSTQAHPCNELRYPKEARGPPSPAHCVSNSWRLGSTGPGVQAIRLSSPDSPDFEQLFHVRVVSGPLTIIGQPPSPLTGEAGSTMPIPLEVRVLAPDGSPLPRVVVRFLGEGKLQPINPADTGLSYRELYTDADGRAPMAYTFPTSVGVPFDFRSFYKVEAGVVQLVPGSGPGPLFWRVDVLPGPVAELRILAGNDQAGTAGQPLGLPLQVRVADQFNNGIAGVTVVWTVTSGEGSLAESTTVSGVGGLIENIWTLGPSPGSQSVSATVGELSVTFNASAGGS